MDTAASKMKKLKQAQLSFLNPGKKLKAKPSVLVMDEQDKENQHDNENEDTESFSSRKPVGVGEIFFGKNKEMKKLKDTSKMECIVIESSDTDTDVVIDNGENSDAEGEKPQRKRQRLVADNTIPSVIITAPTPVKKLKTSRVAEVNKTLKQQKRARPASPILQIEPNTDVAIDGTTFEETPSKKAKASDEVIDGNESDKLNESTTSVTSTTSIESKTRTSTRKKKHSADAMKKKEEQVRLKNELKLKREKEKQEKAREKMEKAMQKMEMKLKKEEIKRQKTELEEKIRQEKIQILEDQKRKKEEELRANLAMLENFWQEPESYRNTFRH